MGYGDVDPASVTSRLEIRPRHLETWGVVAAGVVPSTVAALQSGECGTIALPYAVAARTTGRQFGGTAHRGGGWDSYYYHPWQGSGKVAG